MLPKDLLIRARWSLRLMWADKRMSALFLSYVRRFAFVSPTDCVCLAHQLMSMPLAICGQTQIAILFWRERDAWDRFVRSVSRIRRSNLQKNGEWNAVRGTLCAFTTTRPSRLVSASWSFIHIASSYSLVMACWYWWRMANFRLTM